MKFSKSMILWATVLTLSGVFGTMPAVVAQEEERTTAKEVVDKDTLKAFVGSARDYFLSLPLSDLLVKTKAILQEEGGDWNYKSMYLVVLFPDGTVYSHGEDPSQDNTNIIDAVDDNGKEVVKEILAAADANEEGGFVQYSWDDPATDEDINPRYCYAIRGSHPQYPVTDFILVGGYHHNVTSMTDDSEDLPALHFAHFANGGGITSDIVVVNASANAVQPDIYFYDKMGHPIDAGSVVDVMGQGLEVTSDGTLTVPNPILPLGEVTIPTHGTGDLMTGSVKVVSDSSGSSIGGVLRFDLTGVGVAGVGSSQPVRDAIFPARRMANGINTGAAFRNLSESELTLTCSLMKDGQELEDSMVTLQGNGQDAKFIHEMFAYDTSDFTGSVRCTSPAGEQEFTAVALELDTNNGIFTTLPVVPVVAGGSGSGNGSQTTLYFAHFANGGGITSDVVVVNAAASAARPGIYFYDKTGQPIDAGSVVDVMGQGLEVTSDGALTVPDAMPPLGEVTIPTHGTGDLTTGSVKVVSDSSGSSIGGVLRFDLTGVGVAGVGSSQPVRDAIFPARRMTDGINTGAAFRNLSESELTLTCSLMKNGQELEDSMVTLQANGQDAKFIHELFEYDTSAFTGSVRCTAPAGQQEFAAVALELDTNNGIFTTLPVVPVAQSGTASGN